jgi:copper chaperone CopZ
MNTFIFKTNINCGNCVAKVTPFFNENPQIDSWEVDTKNQDKLLTIQGQITEQEVKALVHLAGFHLAETHKEHQTAFWSDAPIWHRAGFNTLNCLIGCSIGDFSMMIYLQTQYPAMNMWWMMALAIMTGLATSVLLESVILKVREKFSWRMAFQTAMMMSFLSMVVMELAENGTDLVLTGGQFHFHQPYYWFVLLACMVVGFVVPLPYNYYKLKKFGIACH